MLKVDKAVLQKAVDIANGNEDMLVKHFNCNYHELRRSCKVQAIEGFNFSYPTMMCADEILSSPWSNPKKCKVYNIGQCTLSNLNRDQDTFRSIKSDISNGIQLDKIAMKHNTSVEMVERFTKREGFRLTEQEVELALEMLKSNTATYVAHHFGVSNSSISYLKRKHGLYKGQNARREQAKYLKAQGNSQENIARIMEITQPAVSSLLKHK